jgi:hypothetical protein
MPYIKQADRLRLDTSSPMTAGELNYELTLIVQTYLGKDYNYQKINDAVGALESAKLELYRRLVAPYEDKKIKDNGDVY